jgi:Holliday junction resolvasome RuvABC endonuclease subunit
MTVIGLDLSTKAGFCVLIDGKLIKYGVIKAIKCNQYFIEDFNMVKKAKIISSEIYKIMVNYRPDFIFIEQTNSGRFRSSQKQLEFIHYAVIDSLINEWGIPHDCKNIVYLDSSRWRSDLKIRLSKDQKKHNKLVKNKFARGKITSKHLSVKWVNENFNLKLKLKDNDIADSICVGYSGYIQVSQKKGQSLDSALMPN